MPCGTAWLWRRLTGTAGSGVWCGRGSGQDVLGTEEPAQRRMPLPGSPPPGWTGLGAWNACQEHPSPRSQPLAISPPPPGRGPQPATPTPAVQDRSSHRSSFAPLPRVSTGNPSRTADGEGAGRPSSHRESREPQVLATSLWSLWCPAAWQLQGSPVHGLCRSLRSLRPGAFVLAGHLIHDLFPGTQQGVRRGPCTHTHARAYP